MRGPRTAGPFRRFEDPKLDAGGVGDAAHEAVEGIDLADQMAFAETADGGIAGHRANSREPMRDQGRARAHARCRRGCFTAGVAAADHNDIEGRKHLARVPRLARFYHGENVVQTT